jgi:hypothetical protein
MSLAPSAPAASKRQTIRELKEEIRKKAEIRQAQIERGEYDIPLRYSPLSTSELFDLLGQVEYRRDFLELAVPPPEPSLVAKIKRAGKKFVATALRWLMIRQVEFNTLSLEHARESSRIHALADKNVGELFAAVAALRLQMNALAQRLETLEVGRTDTGLATPETAEQEICQEGYEAYLQHLKNRAKVLVADCQRGDLLRLLISEGIHAQGVDADPNLAEYCLERDLPVVCARGLDHLAGLQDDSLDGLFLGLAARPLPPRDIGMLLSVSWTKLRKEGVLIVEMKSPGSVVGQPRIPAELLSFLVESSSFDVAEFIFSGALRRDITPVVQSSSQQPFDQRMYRTYAVVARK